MIFKSKEITPEQSTLLKRPNFSQYPTDEELSTNKGSKKTNKTKLPTQKRRVTYFAKENKELGEYFNFYDFVLRKIATGQIAFIWEDKTNGTKGLGSHLGLSKSNKERNKRIWMLSNEEGLYPEVAAEALLSQYAEEAFGQTEGLPEDITGMTTMDAFNTLMDVLQSYDTRNSMMRAVNIGGRTYRAKNTIHEFKNKNFATTPHSYEITEIELIEDRSVTPTSGIDKHLNRSTNSITTTKLLQGVEKSYDKGKKILEESKNTYSDIRFHLDKRAYEGRRR